jgi:hypothetical protein
MFDQLPTLKQKLDSNFVMILCRSCEFLLTISKLYPQGKNSPKHHTVLTRRAISCRCPDNEFVLTSFQFTLFVGGSAVLSRPFPNQMVGFEFEEKPAKQPNQCLKISRQYDLSYLN